MLCKVAQIKRCIGDSARAAKARGRRWRLAWERADCSALMPNTHRRRQRDSTVESRRVGGLNRIRNYSSRRLPTDSVDNLETGQTP